MSSELELGRLATEQVRRDLPDLDLLSLEDLVALMCDESRRAPEAVVAAKAAIAEAVKAIVDRLERGGRLVYVGAGTAGRLGMLDAAEAGPTFDVPAGQVVAVLAGGAGAFDVAVENAEDDDAAGAAAVGQLSVGAADAVVGIAASGRTPYVLGALAAANAAGAVTIGLTCNAGTPVAEAATIAIEAVVGPEVLAGSTRLNAGTAQKIVLNILSTAAMVSLGKTYGGLMVDLRATNEKLRIRAAAIVAEIAGVSTDRAREALEASGWRAKTAAASLLGGVDPDGADGVLARHGGRLRAALGELAPAPTARRLGVAAALVAGRLVRGDVSVEDGVVVDLGLPGRGTGIAIPMLVDTQVNGYAGVDFLAADEAAIAAAGEALRRDGVQSYLPTLITSDERSLLTALERIARVARVDTAIAGVHLEGPFLSPERAGAHPPEHLRLPDRALLERLLAAGPVRLVTIAPELPGALELIAFLRERGIVVSLGHTAARADDARRAFAAGATAVTHLYNAMSPLTARDPGVVGAALTTPGVTVQLIADGVHVDDVALRVAFAAAAGRWSLVSDAIAAAGAGDGTFELGSVTVEVRDGVARRADGTLAGSAARLVDGVARAARLDDDLAGAVAAATERPARLTGAPFRGLEPGAPADLIVLEDDFSLRHVVSAGGRSEA